MNNNFEDQIRDLERCIYQLNLLTFQASLDSAITTLSVALKQNLPVLVCGNGGSAADSQHISGELVGRFLKNRRALNVRALSTDSSVITAWANDVDFETIFSRQVEAYAEAGGILWAISTSGNSKNVVLAAVRAKELGMSVISLTGTDGGALAKVSDVLLAVPSTVTPRIQEMHMMIYHYLCECVESYFEENI